MKRAICLAVLLVLLTAAFTGCGGKEKVKLSPEQNAMVDILVENREQWKETYDYRAYPVTRVHVSELKSGDLFLTVAYMEDGSGVFVGARGHVVMDGKLYGAPEYTHESWIVDCMKVDMEHMTDEELREVLVESYIRYLTKKAK